MFYLFSAERERVDISHSVWLKSQKDQPGTMAWTYHNTQEVRGLVVGIQGQPGQHSETLSGK